MTYGDYGNFWVIKGMNRVFNRSQCVMWERHANGTMWPRDWEAGFSHEEEAWAYLFRTRPDVEVWG